ncbi:MAG TPA: hypothetical protein VMX13_00775 [Sedimentisphaerales bacterium]|nr:hypothetical protein [Sedimentisphaerales bacterium]
MKVVRIPTILIFSFGVFVLFGLVCFGGNVNVAPWGGPSVTPFPAENPPSDPPLPEGASADEEPNLGFSHKGFSGTWDPRTNKFTVTHVNDVNVYGHTDIREPNNVDPNLHEHELGHDRLNQYEYERRARTKMEEALEGFEGTEFVGQGATPAQREADAKRQAKEEFERRIRRGLEALAQQMDELSAKYDELTGNGAGDDPNTARGEAGAKRERERAGPAGSMPAEPNDANEGTSGGEESANFDDDEQRLIFGGGEPMPITYAGNPGDPIIGRGLLSVESMVLIGVRDNGTIHLSDSSVQIIDSASPNDILLSGFIFEVAYMESTVPGYAGMIQGYLDIPPEWAGGTNNTIGSSFLTAIQAAGDANQLTTFWFYANEELFDDDAQSLISPLGVQGTVVLGVGTPSTLVSVEDFEGYHSSPDLQTAWVSAGNAEQSLSTDIVHSGKRAIEIAYNNTTPPYFSEVTYTYDSPQDWTIRNVKALDLWINDADANNCIDELYIRLEDTDGDSYSFITIDNDESWQGLALDPYQPWWKMSINLQDFEDGHNVNLNIISKVTIGIGDGIAGGNTGTLYVDDIRLRQAECLHSSEIDFNGDCTVNFNDFAFFADAWLNDGIWP